MPLSQNFKTSVLIEEISFSVNLYGKGTQFRCGAVNNGILTRWT